MKVTNFSDERELLNRLIRRDEKAFRLLYDMHRKKVYTFALRILSSPELAEEIMQETFLKLWNLKEQSGTVNSVEAYLRTISKNLALNVLRRQGVEARANEKRALTWEEGHNDTEELILLNDSRKLLNRGIERLSAQQKIVYELCQQKGLSYEEVGDRLNISPLTVKSHLQQAVRSLRKYLSQHPDVAILLIIFSLN